ncbi:hypothetical protein F5X99DRAFT_400861 [Biscogniauxia marginata]|nr:hypothetical protein F5X99DRAFT_400861 [Biscogniauxia marginata]
MCQVVIFIIILLLLLLFLFLFLPLTYCPLLYIFFLGARLGGLLCFRPSIISSPYISFPSVPTFLPPPSTDHLDLDLDLHTHTHTHTHTYLPYWPKLRFLHPPIFFPFFFFSFFLSFLFILISCHPP